VGVIFKSVNSFVSSWLKLCVKLTGSIFSRAGSVERDDTGRIALGDDCLSGTGADEALVSAIVGGAEAGKGFPEGPRDCSGASDDSGSVI